MVSGNEEQEQQQEEQEENVKVTAPLLLCRGCPIIKYLCTQEM